MAPLSALRLRRALVGLVLVVAAVVLVTAQARATDAGLPYKVTASPTSNVVDGEAVTVTVDGTAASNGGTATTIYEVKAIVCRADATVRFDADIWPSQTGQCILHPLSEGTDSVVEVATSPPNQTTAALTYHVGIGTDTYGWGPGKASTSTITCDPTHPCQLVVRVSSASASDPTALVSFPLHYWDGISTTTTTSTSTSSTTVAPTPFPDVPTTNPFYADINWLVSEGITSGYGDGTFKPAASVSRQAFATFLYRYAGEPPFDPPATPSFNDVPTTHPFYEAIEWLSSTGVTAGYGDGGFHPSDTISRQAIATFLYRYAGEPPFDPPSTASFNDVPTTHPFFQPIEWLVSVEVTGGYDDGGFHPSASVSRQATAAFLHRFDGNVTH